MKNKKHLAKGCHLKWLPGPGGQHQCTKQDEFKRKARPGCRANERAQPHLKAFTSKLFNTLWEGRNKASKPSPKLKPKPQTKHTQSCILPVRALVINSCT